MKIDNIIINKGEISFKKDNITDKSMADIVFVFGYRENLNTEIIEVLKSIYTMAQIVGASTAGNIFETEVLDAEIVCTAINLENKSHIQVSEVNIENKNTYEVALQIKHDLHNEQLKHIFILSDGLNINGSKLTNSLNHLKMNATISGGLAGDGDKFQKTATIHNNSISDNRIVAIGFYGDIEITTGCKSGWSEFGTERLITKSKNNIVYEIDGTPALDLYKRYLGEYAKDLPGSGLRFPLSIKQNDSDHEVIRTLLAINEEDKSITFAGDVPEGYLAILMKPDMDLLIDGAKQSAYSISKEQENGLCIAVSCVGRKIILNRIVNEEIEVVKDEIGESNTLIGFYSYGEIAPMNTKDYNCKLHNQTMTLTCIREK